MHNCLELQRTVKDELQKPQLLKNLCKCVHVFILTTRSCELSDTIRYVDNPLSTDRPGIGVNLIYMAMEGVFFFILTLLLEVRCSILITVCKVHLQIMIGERSKASRRTRCYLCHITLVVPNRHLPHAMRKTSFNV